MEFILREQKDILEVQNELMNILPDLGKRPYKVEIKRYFEKRSLDANAYFHLLVDKIAKAVNRSAEEVKIQMNLDYGTYIEDETSGMLYGFMALKSVPVTQFCKYAKAIKTFMKDGKEVVQYLVRKNTSDLNSKEMAALIDGVIQEAQQLGIQTLTPTELALLEGYQK